MDLNPDAVFGDHLRRMRAEAGLTQQQLSDKMAEAGIPMWQSTVAKIEAGQRQVSIGEAVRFAAALGIGLSELIDGQMGDLLSGQLRIASLEYRVSELTRLRDEDQILLEDAQAKLQQARSDQLSRESRQRAQSPAVSAGAPASGL